MMYLSRLPGAAGAPNVPFPASPPSDSLVRSVELAAAHLDRSPEFCLTIAPHAGETPSAFFGRLASAVKYLDGTVLKLMVFAALEAVAGCREAMRQAFGSIDWPVTWVEGAACDGLAIAGVQLLGISGHHVERIPFEGRTAASVFESGGLRHCLVGGIAPTRLLASRADQTAESLDTLQAVLHRAGFSLGDVARTWFFLDELLAWYGEFNQVRTELYSRTDFRNGSLPASTGVSGRNPSGTALALGAWATQSVRRGAAATEVASPRQGPAPDYGSSFSRAMELSSDSGRRLLVSGTASIGPNGETVWVGDIRRQIGESMKVVEALLERRGFTLNDVTRAVAYFKNASHAPLFQEWCCARQTDLPAIPVRCDICRDDLLFEIELDAWRP